MVGQVKLGTTKVRPNAVGCGIFVRFSNINKCRSEVAGDVISGVAVDKVGMDVRAICRKPGLNSGRII